MAPKSYGTILFALTLTIGCSRPQTEVPGVDSQLNRNSEIGDSKAAQGEDSRTGSTIKNDLDVNAKRIKDLEATLAELTKKLETAGTSMSELEKKQLEDQIAAMEAQKAAELAKKIALEKEQAASKPPVPAPVPPAPVPPLPPAPAKLSGKLHFLYASDCMDIVDSGTADGSRVQSYPCEFGPSQQFILETITSGFRIVNVNANKCVVIENALKEENIAAVLQPCKRNGDANELFNFVDGAPPNSFKLKNLNSGLCLKIGSDGLIFQGNCATNYTEFTQKLLLP